MCGFVGFTFPDSDNKAKIDIKKMMSTIKHRGPDENSIYVNFGSSPFDKSIILLIGLSF